MRFLRADLRFDSSFQIFSPLSKVRILLALDLRVSRVLFSFFFSKCPIESDFYSNFSVARGWFLLKFPKFPRTNRTNPGSVSTAPRWSLFVTRGGGLVREPSRTDFLVKRSRHGVCCWRGAAPGPLERKSGVWGAQRALQDKLGEDLATSKWLAVVRPWIMHSFLETCFLRGWL